jgi:uncharacterized protein
MNEKTDRDRHMQPAGSMRIAALYRYPVKGLSPERVLSAELTAGGYWPGDRLFAIENGPTKFDAAQPDHRPKLWFLMLMRHEKLARLTTRFDDARFTLSIEGDGVKPLCADLRSPEGQAEVEAFFSLYLGEALRGAPKLLSSSADFRFTDSRSGFVSLINQASVDAIETLIGAPVDPLRFRGNIYVEGLAPNAELDWPPGARLSAPDGTVFEVIKRIDRCAATNVDPATGRRDQNIPKALMEAYGHMDCGIYLRVLHGGRVAEGNVLEMAREIAD